MPTTVNYSWTTPVVGGSLDTWGTILNNAFDAVDSDLNAVDVLATAALPKSGGTMTGALVLSGAPTVDLHAATKLYVDTADGTKAPTASPTFTGVASFAAARTASVTDSSSAGVLTVNCQDSNVFKVALTENVSSIVLSNPSDGQTINVRITQGGGTAYTVAWPASFKWQGGSAGAVSTALSAVDLLVATYYADTGHWYVSLQKGLA